MPGWRSAAGAVTAVLSAFFLAGLLATSAWPRMHAGPNMLEAGHRLAGAVAPLDSGGSFGNPAAAYSFRKLKSTYAGSAMRLRRASDNLELNIGFLGFSGFTGAPWDGAAAAAHCNATTCFVVTAFDQSGNGRDATQATAANQPQLVFNCNGALPCMRTTAGVQKLNSGSVAWVAAKTSVSAVAKRVAGTGDCYFAAKGNNAIGSSPATANQWYVIDFVSSQINLSATDNAWHASSATFDGAASVGRLDATETTGNLTGTGAAGPVQLSLGTPSTTCDVGEGVLWDNYALTAAERAALQANQKSYWGTP